MKNNMKQFLTLVGFVIASITTGCGQSHTVWLDDLDLTAMTQGNGVAMKNKAVVVKQPKNYQNL